MVLCPFCIKSKSIIKTNKDNQMKYLPHIIVVLVSLYIGVLVYSLWNSFTTIEEIEETFIEVEK